MKRLVRIFEYSFENFKRASIRNFAFDRFFFFSIGILFSKNFCCTAPLIDWYAFIMHAFESVFYDSDDAITTASNVSLFTR